MLARMPKAGMMLSMGKGQKNKANSVAPKGEVNQVATSPEKSETAKRAEPSQAFAYESLAAERNYIALAQDVQRYPNNRISHFHRLYTCSCLLAFGSLHCYPEAFISRRQYS